MNDDTRVEISDLELDIIKSMTKQEIAKRLADKWLESDEAKKILKSITINIDELKHRICDRMIQEIILNWKENKDVH
jgi:hypothetical protein